MYEAHVPCVMECMTCRVRVLCFHNAGSAEDMFTSEGTGARQSPSPLLVSTAQFHTFDMKSPRIHFDSCLH